MCDPSLAKVDSYYYLAYTGQATAFTRQVFVARSGHLNGPWTKWNGTGWGGNPAPITTWVPQASGPSLINKAGTLYLYYATRVNTGQPIGAFQTRLATAPIGTGIDPSSWPTRLLPDAGTAIDNPGKYSGFDCLANHWPADTDVAWDQTTGKFLALTSDQASYKWSALQAYESADGRTFTRTTITRGDYQQGARTPGQLTDLFGHITPGAPTAIAYAHTTGCHNADLRYTTTTQHNLTTGGINDETLTSSVANWHPVSGNWQLVPGKYYFEDLAYRSVYESTLTGRALTPTSTISVDLGWDHQFFAGAWMGVHFAKVHPDDTVDESGYYASLERPFIAFKLCVSKAGFGTLACRELPDSVTDLEFPTLTVVQSGSGIKAFMNGDPSLGVAVTDGDDPYLGGYTSLASYYMSGKFKNFSAADNVPDSYSPVDWSRTLGDWDIHDHVLSNRLSGGQVNLQCYLGPLPAKPSQLGDGTYSATLSLPANAPPTAWGGLAIVNNDGTGSYSSGGYLVFLRANGNLGIWKAGTGQVVADIPTNATPTQPGGLRLRVVKTRNNYQVYVGDRPDPFIDWSDTSGAWAIGSFGLANFDTPATFTDVTFNGNDGRRASRRTYAMRRIVTAACLLLAATD